MKKETILKKAIEKARKNGYLVESFPFGSYGEFNDFGQLLEPNYNVIFSHDFAKAFWGEACHCGNPKPETNPMGCYPDWAAELKTMVLKKDPLLYLEKFL